MAQIQFSDDALQPTKSSTSGYSPGYGGVYSVRNASRRSLPDHPSDAEALAAAADRNGDGFGDGMGVGAEGAGARRDGDIKRKQEFRGWHLAWLAYQSVGVIYGDIGTSPLYVYSSTFSSSPSYDDLLGALSLIIWSLTLIVTVKYVVIVLHADDEGEGGTFAVYSLLSRYVNIVKRDPKELSMVKMERYVTNETSPSYRTFRRGMENSSVVKTLLKVTGVLGVSLIMSDGVLTPAQSVLGAIQGISVVNPNVTTSTIVGISCAILVLLFVIQPLGTSKIASAFAPIVIVWLLFNAVFGIYNLVVYDHSVLRAFSPYFAGAYLVRNGEDGWKSLGGILLAFTGCEALFADLGAFSRHAVQFSWLAFAFPCLLLAYIGQAAFISVNPDAYSNPFFNTVPNGTFWPSQIIAILAAIVASQAMITSTFQLLSQIMKLSYFPHIKLVHTSKVFHGQIYIPMANWLLMIGTVIVTAVYNNTTSLGNAYGVCVILVTFITTCMVSLVALLIWRYHFLIVLVGFVVFAALDGAFLSSALTKVPSGAWFTLLLACLLASIFILWRFGKEQQWKAEAGDFFPPSRLITRVVGSDVGGNKSSNDDRDHNSTTTPRLRLTDSFGGGELTMIKGFALFFDKAGDMTPTVFAQFVTKFVAAPEIMVFFHLRALSAPTVPVEDRYAISETGIPNCYRLVIRHGYTDEVISENLAMLVYDQVRAHIIRSPIRRGSTVAGGGRPRGASATTVAAAVEKTPTQTLVIAPASSATSTTNGNGNGNIIGSNGKGHALPREQQEEEEEEIEEKAGLEHGKRSGAVVSEREGDGVDGHGRPPKIHYPEDDDEDHHHYGEEEERDTASVAARLRILERNFSAQVLYIVGKEQMRIRPETALWRRVLLSTFLWMRENSRSKMAAMRIPTDKLVEVGFVKEV